MKGVKENSLGGEKISFCRERKRETKFDFALKLFKENAS